MARRLGTVFLWCAALLVSTLSAQDRQIGGVGITISEDIFGGTWEVCAGQNWAPRCLRLSESQSDLKDYGFDNRIVSVRPVGARPR